MSLYSGKCDCANWMTGETDEETLAKIKNTDIYLYNSCVPLRIDTIKDLVPFYPYIVAIGYYSSGKSIIHLSEESYVDREEREHLEFMEKDVRKYINRCKRKKVEVNTEWFNNLTYEFHREEKTEILKRIIAGDKEPTKDIHLPMNEYYRKELYKEMIRVGWDEYRAKQWCFGIRKEYSDGI